MAWSKRGLRFNQIRVIEDIKYHIFGRPGKDEEAKDKTKKKGKGEVRPVQVVCCVVM